LFNDFEIKKLQRTKMFNLKYWLFPRYEEKELYEMLRGFQEDFPEGGIYRY
jgi:hypothetical protein